MLSVATRTFLAGGEVTSPHHQQTWSTLAQRERLAILGLPSTEGSPPLQKEEEEKVGTGSEGLCEREVKERQVVLSGHKD